MFSSTFERISSAYLDHDASVSTYTCLYTLLAGASTLLAFYAIILVLYRLVWHPLARFPGPKMAAATRWYECYYDTCKAEVGQYSWKIRDMHNKYGPIVRVTPDEIHVQDPEFFNTLYAPLPARRDKYPPAAAMSLAPKGTFGTIEHNLHRKRRLAASPLFSRRNLSHGYALIYERAGLLCDSIAKAYYQRQIIHAHTTFLAFTTDLMSAYVLGRSLGCQTDEALAEDWNITMETLPRIIPFARQFPLVLAYVLQLPESWIGFVLPKLSPVVRLWRMMHEESHAHANNRPSQLLVSKNSNGTKERMTIFEAIDSSKLPPKEKNISRQAQEAFVLISAGTETTTRVICAAVFHLVANPSKLQMLRQELKCIIPHLDGKPELAVLEAQPYLTAVIKETLRVMQLMTSRFPLIAPNDLQYGNWIIPAGTPISMTISDVLSDPSIFPHPYSFEPERWLDETGKLHGSLDRFFVAFGRGSRMCIGKDLAWAELYVCISQVFRRFDLELFDTTRTRDVDVVSDCFLGAATGQSAGIRFRVKDILAT